MEKKKECIWVSSDEVNEPTACYTKWNKSEREKQISYINAYIWNLGKWYWWTYLQGRNRDSDIENRFMDTAGEGEGRMNWGSSTEIHTSLCVKQIPPGVTFAFTASAAAGQWSLCQVGWTPGSETEPKGSSNKWLFPHWTWGGEEHFYCPLGCKGLLWWFSG